MLYPVLVTAIAVLGAFIVPVFLSPRQASPRAQDDLVSAGPVGPGVIQNSLIAYAIGLVTLAPLLAWGLSGQFWPGIVYVVFVGLGLSLIYVLRRPVLQFLDDALTQDRSITVHEFISRTHGRDSRVRIVAAALTVFAVCGLIVCQMLALATVLKPLLSGTTGITELSIMMIFLVAILCSLFSGHTGIMHATQFQLGLFYLGLFGSTAILLYLQVSELGAMPLRGLVALPLIALICAVIHFGRHGRYVDANPIRSSATSTVPAQVYHEHPSARLFSRFQKILNALTGVFAITLMVFALVIAALELLVEGASKAISDDLTALLVDFSVNKITLISLALLSFFHPIVDIVNWQRLAAFVRSPDLNDLKEDQWTEAFRSFCATYVVEVPLVGLFICLFGAVAGLTLATPTEADSIQAFIVRFLMQENLLATTVVSFLLFGLFALAVSTMASLFSAGVCAIRLDIVPMFRSAAKSQLAGSPEIKAKRLTLIAAVVIGFAILMAFHLADTSAGLTMGRAKFLGLVLGFSSAQLSFAPLVLAPLIIGTRGFGTLTPGWALAVLIVSSSIGVGITATGVAVGIDLLLPWAAPACLGSAAALFVIASSLRQRPAVGL
jgi:hypothetical protein